MYSILVKDSKNLDLYRFLTIKREVMQEQTKEVTDPETDEVRTEITSVGTGTYEVVRFETNVKSELENKCVELLNTYNRGQFIAVNVEPYQMDLIWDSESQQSE